MPVLYGTEKWVLTQRQVKKMETFQGGACQEDTEVAYMFSNNSVASGTLEVPILMCRMLVATLGFLKNFVAELLFLCVITLRPHAWSWNAESNIEEPFDTAFTGDIVCKKLSLKVVKKLFYE